MLLHRLIRRWFERPDRGAVAEACEPRILYSADPVGLQSMVAEVRMVDEPASALAQASATAQQRHEIAFVDAAVQNRAQLVAGLDPALQVIDLDRNRDGVAQITEALQSRTDIAAIHLISHGADGQVQLGSVVLDSRNLADHAASLNAWARSLTPDADLLIYGCDIARSAQGRALAASIADLTGADVQASIDATGSAALGGNWNLEFEAGTIEASVALGAPAQQQWAGLLDITNGLQGHWRLDANASDASGNGYNGTLTNGAAIDTNAGTNKVGAGKLSLDGTNDYVDLSAHRANFTGLTQGTISAWIKTTDSAGATIFDLSDVADADSYAALWLSAGKLNFDVYENGTALLEAASTSSVNNGAWRHVAVTVGATGSQLFIDGVPAGMTFSTGTAATQKFFSSVTGVDFMAIGMDQHNAGLRDGFAGLIDDVRVYDRALSAADVAELATTAPTIAGLAGDTQVYTAGAGAVLIEQGGNVTVSDIDSADFSGGALTVSIAAGGDAAEDVLAIRHQGTGIGQIGVSGANVTYGGTTIGSFAGGSGGANLVVTLNAGANPTNAAALIQNITYQNTDTDRPTADTRTVRFALSDGDGGTSSNVDATVTLQPQGSLIWRTNADTSPNARHWTGTAFGSAADSAAIGNLRGIRAAESPVRDEMIVVGRDAGTGNIVGERWDGTSWSGLPNNPLGNVFLASTWMFDVAYESGSGNAMLVWGDGNALEYSVWSGSAWTASAALSNYAALSGGSTPASHVRLASNPGSNEMVLAVTDNLGKDYAFVWNGSAWGAGQQVSTGSGSSSAVAYEQQSGRAMIAYADAATPTLYYRLWNGSSWSAQASVAVTGGAGGTYPQYIQLASDPNSNRIGVAVNPSGTAGSVKLSLDVWDGSAWVGGQLATGTGVDQLGPGIDLAFEKGSGDLIAAYGSTGSALLRYRTWTPGGGWSAEQNGPTLGAAPRIVTLAADPQSDRVMMTSQDGSSDLYAAQWSGTAWGAPTAVELNTGATNEQPFEFVWVRPAASAAPVASGLSGDGFNYTVGSGAVAIDQGGNAAVTDIDSSDFDGGTLTVSFAAGSDAVEDVLAIRNQGTGAGQVGVSGVNVTYGGATIGTYSGGSGGSGLVVTLNVNADATSTAALLRNITFQDTDGASPTTGTRTVRFTLSDGDGGVSANVDASVTLLAPGSSAGLWLSSNTTATSSSGVSWSDGTVVKFADPNLAFEPGTTAGTFSTEFDLDTFAADGNADALGLYLVRSSLTVGSGGNSVALQAGDVLFSTSANETFGGVAGTSKDLWLFRPATPGTYTAGTFSILLNSPSGDNLQDVSLVESATAVGGITLNAGDFLISQSSATYDKDVWRFAPTAVGDGTTAGTLTEFIDGADIGIGQKVGAVEFINQPGALGTTTLQAGSFVLSVLGDDTVGDNNLAVTKFDLFVLDVTQAGTSTAATATLLLQGSDVGMTAGGEEFDALALVGLNQAPVLSGANSLTAILEDPSGNPGTLVSDLVSGKITDGDTDPLVGIAVTAVDNTNGSWQWSANGGTTWNAFGSPGTVTARLLYADAHTYVRFVPNANWNGTVASGITFRAWDATTGVAGLTANTTSNGGSSAFSAATASAAITVTAVNDAPVLDNNGTMTMGSVSEENSSGASVGTIIAFAGGDRITDVDSGALEGVAVTAVNHGNGTWRYSVDGGTTYLSMGSVSETSALLLRSTDLVAYSGNGLNGGTADFSFRAWDRTSGTAGTTADASTNGGSTAFSTATESASITITSVNDAPTITSGATVTLAATSESSTSSGTAVSSILAAAGWADVDTGAVNGLAITAKTGYGTWQYSTDGVTWAGFGPVSGTAALLLSSGTQVRYVPDGSNGETSTFSFKAWDRSAEAASTNAVPSYATTASSGGTTAFSSSNASASIAVAGVNDAPTISNGATVTLAGTDENTTSPGTTVDSILTSASWADVDGGAAKGIAITGKTGNGTWQYSTDGVTWAGFGSVSSSSALLLASTSQVRYQPDSANAETATFSFKAWDQTSGSASTNAAPSYANPGAGGGTSAWSSASVSTSLAVAAVNDAPTVSNGVTITLTATDENTASPGTAVNSLLASASWADVDTGASKGIAITGKTGNGTWQYSTDGVAWNGFGAVSAGNALLLATASQVRYLPDSANSETATFSFMAWDQTTGSASSNAVPSYANPGAGGGSAAFSSASAAASLAVSAVNDAPTIGNGATVNLTTTDENTASAGTTVDSILGSASWADVDGGAAKGIAITSKAGNGTWQYSTDGVTWNGFGAASATNALLLNSASQVRYIPDSANAETATFGFKAWDQTSGAASTNAAPAYANPGAGGGSTAWSSASASASMTVTAVNDAPSISSNGGGANAAVSVAEGAVVVTTVSSTDVDGGAPAYSILAGGDGAAFAINAVTGALSFGTAPDWDTPLDVGGDNVYDLTVQVSDGAGGIDTQAIAVTVTRVADGIRVTPISVGALGGETRVNTTTGNAQTIDANVAQAIATDADGNFVVVWTSDQQDGDAGGVFARRYNAAGVAQGGEFQVNTTTADTQMLAAVAMDAAGSFVVTWSSNLQDGSGWGVYAQRFNAAGVAQGGELAVNTTTAGSQTGSSVAMASNGAFVVAWSSDSQDPDGSGGIYAQRYDAAGAAQGGEFRVNTTTAGTQQLASLAMGAAGNFVVTWASDGQDGDGYGIFGQRFDATGVAQGAEFKVNTTTVNSQLYNDVAMLPDGRFVVAYQSRNGDGSFEVYLQRYAADGSALGGETQANTTTVSAAQPPLVSVAADADGNITVVWNDGADGSSEGVSGRRLDWSGSALGAVFQANTTSAGSQLHPEVVAQPGGRFIVAWGGNGSGDADGVFLQRYGLATTEGGGTATFQVALKAAPTADVVVPLSVSQLNQGTLSAASLTFTAANWNVAQTVTVTGLQDYTNDDGAAYAVVLGLATSADAAFNGIDPSDLTVVDREVANLAPVNSVPGAQTVGEDGSLVFSAANGNAITISDTDAGSRAIEVTLTVTHGTLTLGGNAGLTFSAGSDGSATMSFSGTIASINAALDGLRYDPTPDHNGAALVSIDTSDLGNTGTGGARLDGDTIAIAVSAVNDAPSIGGGATVALTATDENTASAGDTVDSLLASASWADADTGAAKGIAITGMAGNGTWQYSTDGVTWNGFGAVSATNALLLGSTSQVRYLPDSANAETSTFGFRAWDRTTGSASSNAVPAYANPGAGGGSTAWSSQAATASVAVSAVNDAPTLSGGASVTLAGTDENATSAATTVNGILTSASWTDVDGGASKGIAITALAGNGSWQYSADGLAWTAFGAVSATNALLLASTSQVRYIPDAANAETATFGFAAWDQTAGAASTSGVPAYANPGAGGGSSAYSTAAATASLEVTAVNDAPALTNGAAITMATTDENTASPGTAVGALLTSASGADVDAGAVGGIAVVSASGNGGWQYSTDGVTWNGFGAVSGSNGLLLTSTSQVRYVPDGLDAETAAFGFVAWDQTSGTASTNVAAAYANPDPGGGTTAYSSASAAASLIVTAVNDAPTITPGATVTLAATDEDTLSSSSAVGAMLASAAWADVDGAALAGIAVTSSAGNGSWQYSADGVTWAGFGSVSSSSALLLDSSSLVRYLPDGHNGETATFGFVAWDRTTGTASTNATAAYANPGPGGGSSSTSSAAATASLVVAAVNDAPTVSNGTTVTLASTDEDTASPGTTVGSILGSATRADVDSGALAGMAITSSAGNGTWQYSTDGVTWTGFGAVSPSNALLLVASSQVRYMPDGIDGETASFGFVAWDQTSGSASTNVTPAYANPGAGGGTTATSAQTASASLSVAAVNDVPTGLPAITGTATEDQTLTADTAAIADADGLGAFGYQWLRGGSAIGGATSSTYTLGDADVGAQISVRLNYSDGNGTVETLTSAQTAAVGNVNDVPTGLPAIGGTATEDQILTADSSAIADADGLGAFSYQWRRNGVDIGGATAGSYTLGDTDVGTQISVRVNYTDGNGTAETRISAQTAAVANVNDVPTGAPNVAGTAAEDQTLTADTSAIADADGAGGFGYQWLRGGSAIGGATSSTYALGDADVGAQISVQVDYTDGNGTVETLTSAQTAAVANVNDVPTGQPTIAGTATEDQTLTADTSTIADADGLGAFSYQWLRNGVGIGGATAGTYMLGETDVGTQISVRVEYTDGNGTTEALTSAQTAVVGNVNDTPTGLPTIGGIVIEDETLTAGTSAMADADGLGAFSFQWLRGGVAVGGATSSTYTLSNADVGARISVRVGYTDGHGAAEASTSAQTAAVTNVNSPPAGLPAVTGSAAEDQVLTVDASAIADADGLGAFSYQWLREGAAIGGATGSTHGLGDADVGARISVRVTYTDGNGTPEALTSAQTPAVANIDDAPTGAPVVAGTAAEDQTLSVDTSSIADADGLGAVSLQWLRNGTAIYGATSPTYTLGDADVGEHISVRVIYTDGHGTAEALTSPPTPPVAGVNDAPVITSAGGSAAAEVAVSENTTAVLVVTSTDVDGGLPSYAIAGGADAAQFVIDAATGALRFVAAPDAEGPADADTDNVYELTVAVGDGLGGTDTQAIAVRVANVNEVPVIAALERRQVPENETSVVMLGAADPEAEPVSWSIAGGADASRFAVDPATGALRFVLPPDFEAAADHDADNLYRVEVRAADPAGAAAVRAIEVAVLPVNEPPQLALPGAATLPASAAAGTVVAQAAAADADAGDALVFSLVDDAGGRYAIDAATGAITTAGSAGDASSAEHLLRVRVTDAMGLHDESALRVLRVAESDAAVVIVAMLPVEPPAPAPTPVAAEPKRAGTEADTPVEPQEQERPAARTGLGEAADAPRLDGLLAVDPMTESNEAGSRGPGQTGRVTGARFVTADAGAIGLASGAASWWAAGGIRQSLEPLDLSGSYETGLWREEAVRLAKLALRGADDLQHTTGGVGQPGEAGSQPLIEQILAQPQGVAGASVTAGFVWWLTRSGGAIAGVMVGVPAWRHVDLLPVLASGGDDEDDDDGDATRPGPVADASGQGPDGVDGMFEREDRFRADWGDQR